MHFTSVSVLFLSSLLLLLSPLSCSAISLFEPSLDGFQPSDSPDINENFGGAPPPYQGDTSQSPLVPPPDDVSQGSPQLPYIPSPPINDASPPSNTPFVTPPPSDSPLPTPQLPSISPPPDDNSSPLSPQLPFVSPPPDDNSSPLSPQFPFKSPPPHDNLSPLSPQLPFTSSPPLYNAFPGSPQSPLAYHHPKGMPIAPTPFGGYTSGTNQNQQFGQANNNGLFGQQQGFNAVPTGGGEEYGGCGSIRVDMIRTALVLVGVLLVCWV